MLTRRLLTPALAVLLLSATAPALEPPTFSDEVVRILQNRCQTCHRPGEHAPFSLLTYRDAYDKKDDLRDAVHARVMPPWKPVPGFGDFLEPRRLSDAELATLLRWVEACAPGDRKLVHHILSYIDTTSAAEALDRRDPGPGYACFGGPGFNPAGGLSGWAPGIQPRVTPDGVGMLLPKGARVVVQMHYNNNEPESRTDRTRAGLHFAKGPIDKRQRSIAALNRTFTIPAGDRRYEVRASWTYYLGLDLHANTITPHMHLLGRE